ncbi:hypothetical protein [uncultured Winogradskyella sp.]|uniref:hypothetical protein n=1 Tax=uncultured Winogradskyella sp. TaxID=395353 RepID=UPI002606C843|nr:hypothetical protein [uncultured Winogradskyella sp.]
METRRTKLKFIPFTPKELNHETKFYGTINGEEFELVGGGIGQPHNGNLNTELRSTKGPVNFQMLAISDGPVMGYPTYSNYQKGGYDLFKISDGYKYTRKWKFSCGGTMESIHHVKRFDDKMTGDFKVLNANFDAPTLAYKETHVETFYPDGPGRVKSYFKSRWVTENGGEYTADVESTYYLNHNLELPYTHFRFIKFTTFHSDEVFRQDEILTVIHDPEALNL